MSKTFTIKQVPDALANRLRRRAAANRRSLQRELLLILENAASADEPEHTRVRIAEPAVAYSQAASASRRRAGATKSGKLSLDQLWQRSRRLGARSASESADLIRRDRDARHGH